MLVTRNETDVSHQKLLSVMGTSSASAILQTVTEPMTVKEISHYADVPLSTAYREVNRLADVSLLEESIRLDPHRGKHVSTYERTFETIEIKMTDEGVAVQLIS